MSTEELKSIEENGNYWLSKSNTSYHIINPNASDLSYIEEIGNFSLGKSGNQHYILDANGNSIRFDTPKYAPGYSYTDTPLHVEEALDYVGFQNNFPNGVFWVLYQREEWINLKVKTYNKGYFALKYDETGGGNKGTDLILKLDRFGNETNESVFRPYIDYEAMFGVDLNNDGIITSGINPNNLMDISGNKHHIDDGHGGDNIILKKDSDIIDPNSNGGLNATQVEKNGSHYEVLLEHTNVKYDVWKVDEFGNFVSSIKAKLWEDELKFNQDLNGDGDTGLVTVEAIGGVHLKHGDNTFNGDTQYYIVDGIKDPIGLTVFGDTKGPNSNPGWSATQVEDSGTGYEMFWSHSSGKYEVWKVDALGSYQSIVNAHLWQHENTFKVDLNGDSTQGLVTVENIGNVHLAIGDNRFIGDTKYYIVDGIKDPIALTTFGDTKGPNSNPGWSATQVEDSGTGYEMFWSHSSGKYEVWKVDALGSYQSIVNAHLWQHENTFKVDLNGDSTQGLVTVENIGNVHLAIGDNQFIGDTQYYIVDGSNEPIGLTVFGTTKGPNSSSGWSVTQVEDSGTGYEVFWSHSSGKYNVWKVDASGSFQSIVNAHLWQHENTFKVDLNGDSTQGLVTVENIGNVHLAIGDNQFIGDTQYYIVDGSNEPIGLTVFGATKGPNSSSDWSVTQVEDSGTGYEVFWSHSSGKYNVWKVDASGSFQSIVNAHLWQHENTFKVDLNGDSTQGLVTVENIGNVHLAIGDNQFIGDTQYYIVDGSNEPIGLTVFGATKGPNSSSDWSVTQVEDSGTGYEVFWSHSSGKYNVWKVDASGSFQSIVNAHLWQHENTFKVDLNGDSTQGLVTVENIGNVHLAIGDNQFIGDTQYYIVDGSNEPIGLTVFGATKGPNSSSDWSVTQVEDSGTGYEVFWSHSSGKYNVWKVDASGSFQSIVNAHLWQHENTFKVDLNGDSTQGLVTVENIGNVHLAIGDNQFIGDTQYYIVDGSNEPIGLTVFGATKGPNSSSGWSVTQVEDSGTGYEVFWSHSSGKYNVWKVDASGSFQSIVNAHLWQHENTFKVDLNGDGIDSGNNNIYGSFRNDTFDGGAGDDTINGREGHDTLIGGEGNDWISGDGGSGYAGNDILFGNAGNDDLRGRDGNDILDGGTGKDIITTGSGSDTIYLRIGDGGNALSDADIITDFIDGSDTFGLTNGLSFGDLTREQGNGEYANDTIIKYGSEYLAILQNIDVSLLTEADFETVDIA